MDQWMLEPESERKRARTHIRWMICRDMIEVLRIEKASFDFAWSEEDFTCCLRQRNCIGMVAEREEKIVGFMIYELHKAKVHILNLAVDSIHRHNKIGTQMIKKLQSKLSAHRRTRITCELRETNLVAQLWLQALGFRAYSLLHHFYEDSDESAILFHWCLESSIEPEPFDFAPPNRCKGLFVQEAEWEE